MASAMHLLKTMKLSTAPRGAVAIGLDAGIGFGASYALARAYHQYSDKWAGQHAFRLAAGIGKGAALVLSYMAGEPTFASTLFNSVGQAGLNGIGLDMGLRHARAKTGKRAVLVSSGGALPAGASEMASIGALGTAPEGRGMSWAQIQEVAAGR